jgi:predicted nucleic acid-binding protein
MVDFPKAEVLENPQSIKLRKNGITVDDGDLLIAAYCIQNNYILVSNNQKHFEKIENIQVVNWSA